MQTPSSGRKTTRTSGSGSSARSYISIHMPNASRQVNPNHYEIAPPMSAPVRPPFQRSLAAGGGFRTSSQPQSFFHSEPNTPIKVDPRTHMTSATNDMAATYNFNGPSSGWNLIERPLLGRRAFRSADRNSNGSIAADALTLGRGDTEKVLSADAQPRQNSSAPSTANASRTHVRVVARVRPTNDKERFIPEAVACLANDSLQITLADLNDPANRPATNPSLDDPNTTITGTSVLRQYTLDRVFPPDTTQDQFFLLSGIHTLVSSAVEGYASTVFAYGQTGSGKTYTMSGLEEKIISGGFMDQSSISAAEAASNGLIPRCVRLLFEEIKRRPQNDFTVKVSCAEIYNEQVLDLLAGEARPLNIRLNPEQGLFFVENQILIACTDVDDVLAVATEGHRHRHVGSHELNDDSSRSHSILTVHVESSPKGVDQDEVRFGKITFVDLAGSENLKYTKSTGDTLKETGSINKSLFTLGKVISMLGDIHQGRKPRNAHVPYRDSALTKLLMDSLGGSGLTLMIACLSPSAVHADESVRTLTYAIRAKNIQLSPSVKMDPKERLLHVLRQDIRTLMREYGIIRQLATDAGLTLPPPPVLISGINNTATSLSNSNVLAIQQTPQQFSPPLGSESPSHNPARPRTELSRSPSQLDDENQQLRSKVKHLEDIFLNRTDVGVWSKSKINVEELPVENSPTTANSPKDAKRDEDLSSLHVLKTELETLRAQNRTMRMRNSDLTKRIQLLEREQAAINNTQVESNLDELHTDTPNHRKDASALYQIKRANASLERQLELYRHRERELLETEELFVQQLTTLGYGAFAREVTETRKTKETFTNLRSPSRAVPAIMRDFTGGGGLMNKGLAISPTFRAANSNGNSPFSGTAFNSPGNKASADAESVPAHRFSDTTVKPSTPNNATVTDNFAATLLDAVPTRTVKAGRRRPSAGTPSAFSLINAQQSDSLLNVTEPSETEKLNSANAVANDKMLLGGSSQSKPMDSLVA